jgi:hypothetical protein
MLQDYFLISAARLLGNRRRKLFLGRHPAQRLDGFGLPAEAQAVSPWSVLVLSVLGLPAA